MGNDVASSSFAEREAELFEQALDKTGAEREAFLHEVARSDPALHARLKALLAAYHQPDGPLAGLPDPVPPTADATADEQKDEAVGQTIGRYKLLEKIGEGGCGVVYMAEQTKPIRRRVAVKVIKLGMDTKQVVARFEAERQALALMDHANIAKVLDAGTAESGRPYFVMELVRGVKITEYCDENQLSTEQRLNLFVQICHAIQHAHQKGIIHRDIKPSNILVTINDGVPIPKVIDFGVAKAIGQQLTDKTVFTAFEQLIGTPAYMSPEQAVMTSVDIDTRSDIYSLGVLLYELLTGHTPFDQKDLVAAGLDEMRRIIREREPVRPSTRLSTLAGPEQTTVAKRRHTEPPELVHLLRGDLDWIVMKCLEKDRARRYETANALGEDLTRHVCDEVVLARPPSKLYRLRKSIRRNRLTYGASLAVAIALALGIAFSSWEAVRARKAERLAARRLAQAEKARAEAEAISKYMTQIFQSPDPARDGRRITVADTLDKAAKQVETELASQPERRAQLESTLGSTYAALGLFPEAIALQEKARDYFVANSGPAHPDTIAATSSLGDLYLRAGRWKEALKLNVRVLALSRWVFGAKDRHTITAMQNLANSYAAAGQGEEGLRMGEQVLRLCVDVLGPENPNTIAAMHHLGSSYYATGRRDEAIKLREEALRLSRSVLGPDDPKTAEAMDSLAHSYESAGRWEEALGFFEKVLILRRKMYGLEHPYTIGTMSDLAASYAAVSGHNSESSRLLALMVDLEKSHSATERRDEVIKLWEGILTLRRKVNGLEHPDTLASMDILAACYTDAGRWEEALKLRQEVLAVRQKVFGPEHPETLMSMQWQADSYHLAGQQGKALKLREELLALRRKVNGPKQTPTLETMLGLANSYYDAGRKDEAFELLGEVSAATTPGSGFMAAKVGALQVWFGKEADHTALSRRMLQWASEQAGPGPADSAAKIANLRQLADQELTQSALALARRSVEIGGPWLCWFQMGLGMAEYRNGHYSAAEDALKAATEAARPVDPRIQITCGFYLAMILFRQGKEAEARQFFAETKAKMRPIPAVTQWPAQGDHDDLVMWLACREAKALLGKAPTAKP